MASEVLVLGAGMVGVSTALALQQRGRQVVLVDRRPPGRETSYGNAGFIQREAVQPYAFPRSWQALWRVATGQGNDVHVHWTALPSWLAACCVIGSPRPPRRTRTPAPPMHG
jgi:D-amino-acid dehydrogenase